MCLRYAMELGGTRSYGQVHVEERCIVLSYSDNSK